MKRALGAVANWDVFQKMTRAEDNVEAQHILIKAKQKEMEAEKDA